MAANSRTYRQQPRAVSAAAGVFRLEALGLAVEADTDLGSEAMPKCVPLSVVLVSRSRNHSDYGLLLWVNTRLPG